MADLARPTRGGGTRIAAPHSRLWCSCGAAQSRVFAADKQWRVAPTHLRHQTHSAAQRKKYFGILIKIWQHTKVNITFCGRNRWPSLKSALRPLPSARAESANFRPFYVKRADFSPPPPATKKRRKLVKIRPRCPHLATKKRRKVVKIRPCGG